MVERVRAFRTRAGKGVDRLELPKVAFERAATNSQTYADFVGALYSELADLRGKSWAGEKTPDYVRHLALLHTFFPWAKIIHLIRDGRDVTLALMDWAHDGKGPGRLKPWRESPAAASALWWQWQVQTGKRDAVHLAPACYREVRYESLVTTPEETLREVAAFLELPFDARMLTYHVGRTRTKQGLPSNKAWLPPTLGIRDWRTQMRPRDLELVEALVGSLLSELGYERAFPTAAPAVAREARRYQEWWERKLARRTTRSRPSEPGNHLAPDRHRNHLSTRSEKP
jgi:hypothetical protein